jgi:hypothetical protein
MDKLGLLHLSGVYAEGLRLLSYIADCHTLSLRFSLPFRRWHLFFLSVLKGSVSFGGPFHRKQAAPPTLGRTYEPPAASQWIQD